MGVVYEVFDQRTQRRRALKLMLPELVSDPDSRRRFQQEVTVAAGIESEHIVEVFDAGVDAATGAPFLVMELLQGEDFGALLRRAGRLEAQEVVDLVWQLALSLDRTHAVGVVHRDLKPENLFVSQRDDGSPLVKILDFGIAKIASRTSGLADTTRSVGTPLYMSPEQIRADSGIGPSSDLYAVAQIVYTLLVGKPYFDSNASDPGNAYAVMYSVVSGVREPASVRAQSRGVVLSQAFDTWFLKAAAPVANERFESAQKMVEELARALAVALPSKASLRPRARSRVSSIPDAAQVKASTTAGAGVVKDEVVAPSTNAKQRLRGSILTIMGLAAIVAGVVWWLRTRIENETAPLDNVADVTSVGATEVVPPTPSASTLPAETSPTSKESVPSSVPVPALSNPLASAVAPAGRGSAPSKSARASTASSAKPAVSNAQKPRPVDPLTERE
jgi:serine/threonine-protein kinase